MSRYVTVHSCNVTADEGCCMGVENELEVPQPSMQERQAQMIALLRGVE